MNQQHELWFRLLVNPKPDLDMSVPGGISQTVRQMDLVKGGAPLLQLLLAPGVGLQVLDQGCLPCQVSMCLLHLLPFLLLLFLQLLHQAILLLHKTADCHFD